MLHHGWCACRSYLTQLCKAYTSRVQRAYGSPQIQFLLGRIEQQHLLVIDIEAKSASPLEMPHVGKEYLFSLECPTVE